MDERATLQQQVDWLRYGDVMPLLLATDTTYSDDFQVHVVLLDPSDATSGGYSSVRILTKHYAAAPESVEQDQARRSETVVEFADRLRSLLAAGP
jgi:hypothetical protein